MDPITVVIIVIITGGVTTAAKVNPIIIFFTILGIVLASSLPFAAIYATIINFNKGTLSSEQLAAAIWVIGNFIVLITGVALDLSDSLVTLFAIFNVLFILICINPVLIWLIPIIIISVIIFFISLNK